jgi:hypothetical protein
MDTETVLQIINLIDNRLEIIEETFIIDPDKEERYDTGQQIGKQDALEELRDYLQEYIESQVSQIEGV